MLSNSLLNSEILVLVAEYVSTHTLQKQYQIFFEMWYSGVLLSRNAKYL
jgi:hypothetical protein